MFPSLPWQLSCLLLAMASRAQVISSNSSTAISTYSGELRLQDASSQNLSLLAPLTRDALIRNNAPLQGNLVLTDENTVSNLSTGDIGYISCNPDDYQGNIGAFNVLNASLAEHNLTAVVLYSTASSYCGYDGVPEPLQEFPMFSMTSSDDSQKILNDINKPSVSSKFFVTVTRSGSDKDSSNGNDHPPQQNANPLGPSPSTAVAMIILYSITGIITALFLVIIITGAVRAHRHPDRYGPRDVLGRPRQSRARGLGRAILDTIPIVKFGEREPPKPTDVELGPTAEARNVNNNEAHADGTAQAHNDQPGPEGARTGNQAEPEAQRDTITEQASGIAAAEPLAGTAATAQENPSDEGLGCSICTEDFEKGQDIRVLPCNHKFHPECVDPWLLNVSGTCPLCRVDLRPTTSRSSMGDGDGQDPDLLAPPLQPEAETSHRRRSALRDILSLRSRPNASAEERISALRRLREQHRNQSGDVATGSENGSTEDVTVTRRSRRISARLSDVFSSRTRRQHGEEAPAPAPSGPTLTVPEIHVSGHPPASPSNSNNNITRDTDIDSHRRS